MNMRRDDRTLAELEKAYLSDDSAAEFDRLVRKGESRRRRPFVWGAMLFAAASSALILTLSIRDNRCVFDGTEMAEGLQQIMNLDPDNLRSVSATPEGRRVILTALMMDGSRCSYVMSRTDGAEAVTITAIE